MKTKKGSKVSVRILVTLVTVIMLFSMISTSLTTTVSAEEGVFKRNDSIITDYTSFLSSSVVHQLPSTVKDNDLISVIIKLDTPTLMEAYNKTDKKLSFAEYAETDDAKAIKNEISAEKDAYLRSLSSNSIEYSTGADYANVLSGFEVLIRARHFDTACEVLSKGSTAIVGEVYNVAETELVTNPVSYDASTGIFDTSSFPYDGDGMVVAVLDTGLDYTHPAFSTEYFESEDLGLTYDEVASKVSGSSAAQRVPGLTADDVYINEKVPFSFDYADNDSDVYSLHNNHGTHVSGVIVGNDGPDGQLRGSAPDAQLVSMKIFSDTLDSARASWILSALEDCVMLGVDVINMSLGTACGFSREIDNQQMAEVYEAIRAQGISLVVAASNSFSSTYGSEKNGNLGLTSNPDTGTVGSPSTYPGALSVASIDGVKTPYILDEEGTIIYFVESTDSAGEEKVFYEDLLGTSTETLTLDYVLVPGVGANSDYNGIDVTGKIALVRRGSNTFEEKAKAAEKAGAVALIVYNNTSGDIRMNVGHVSIPICSISQDDGEKLAKAKSGKLTFSADQTSGPFMSDFSSWGPSPSLEIKPEITAHGGNILSAVTGHGYDRLSGTSMACPNLAGVIALLRQYVIGNSNLSDEIRDENGNIDNCEVNAIVNRLLMSTADIATNKHGLYYAVRKQGAGIANIYDAAATNAYILTYKNGEVMDKTKIELGDDPDKTGVYTMTFKIKNFGNTALSYDISATVLTEGVSDTPTYKGDTVVTQEGYLLSGAAFRINSVNGGSLNGSKVTVGADSECEVSVTITLSDSDKKYLDDSFENGMYVEGYIELKSDAGESSNLNVPYLAFYGNWNQAPLFDLDYFETNADELNDAIETLDKTLPDAYATRPIGGVSEDYIAYLGSYYFVQDPNNKIISANRDYIAISNQEGTVHSLRFVWGGQLRNADRIVITITDDATGEVIFEKTEVQVRKSYGDGGSYIYPTSIEIEFDAAEHNLKNNSTYSVKLQGYLEYGDGGLEDNLKNTFEFPLTVDFEAPALTGCEFYTEYDKDAKKNRLFVKMAVYDNHYSMGMQVGYVGRSDTVNSETGEYENILNPFENYIVPIYSERNGTTYVTYELTDYIFDIKDKSVNKNSFVVSLYDYAINEATYEIELPDEYKDLYFEETEIELNVNEVYKLSANVYPEDQWDELLEYSCAKNGVLKVVNNEIVALKAGKSFVKAAYKDALGNVVKETTMNVTVVDDKATNPPKPVAQTFEINGFNTLKAFYVMSNDDKDIGETGDTVIFSSDKYSIALYPSEQVQLNLNLVSYFPENTTVKYTSNRESVVQVSENGTITAMGEGFASITVRLFLDGKQTTRSKTISIEVKDPYVRTGPTLNNYYGNGTLNNGEVIIPEDMTFTQIGQYAFSNFEYISKDLEAGDVIDDEDPDATKITFIGNNDIKKVVIPEGVETIGPYAFAGLTALTEVHLPSTLETIEYGAFYGCSNLTKVYGLENVKLINKYAFQSCNITNDQVLTNIHAIGDYAFAGNRNLKSISFGPSLSSIGANAFASNDKLVTVDTSKCGNIKYGPYVFMACTSLKEITMNTSVIPTGAFYNCINLETVHIGASVSTISEYAFARTKITKFSVAQGNETYYPVTDASYLLNKSGDTLLLVAPGATGTFELHGVTKIGYAAFASNQGQFTKTSDGMYTKITSGISNVIMPDVTYVDDYAFSEMQDITSVKLGQLTHIGNYAFFLTSISALPSFDTVNEIGEYAFAFTLITEVNIHDNMTVGEGAFCECTVLKNVTIGNNAVIGDGAFMRGATREDPRNPGTLLNQGTWVKDLESGFYYVEYKSSITSLTIGTDAYIGKYAFMGSANLTTVTLGDGAEIGEMGFYNCSSLRNIDLSGVKRIGKLAFSGDNYYLATSTMGNSYAVSGDKYLFYFYSSNLTDIDLSGLEADGLGEQAFNFNKKLTSVTLGENVKIIPELAFANCDKLASINLENVEKIGYGAFGESSLVSADLSSAKEIGDFAFTKCGKLTEVTLNTNGCNVGEAAFSYCDQLATVNNLDKAVNIGDYGFAYTALTSADLTSAVTVGDLAFAKENMTVFHVTLGKNLKVLGDNPFAMCKLDPFYSYDKVEFNGATYATITYTYGINDYIKIVNGSIYTVVPYGLELTTYVGLDENGNSLDRENVLLHEDTVRVSAMAFAGSDIVRVTLPYEMNSIGHKAFYKCDDLQMVIFLSHIAPKLEEEYDENYYLSFDHIPGAGEYNSSYYVDTDDDGELDFEEPVTKYGIEVVPYYMWNVFSEKYNNVYYGANFQDYVGYAPGNIIMVSPSNGEEYDSFIYDQYFGIKIAGDVVADSATKEAIDAINNLPEKITLKDEDLVKAARAAYDKITNQMQKALITNYSTLTRAEKLIEAYKQNNSTEEPPIDNTPTDEPKASIGEIILNVLKVIAITIAIIIAVLLFIAFPVASIAMFVIAILLFKKTASASRASKQDGEATENSEATDDAEATESAEATEDAEAIVNAEAAEDEDEKAENGND